MREIYMQGDDDATVLLQGLEGRGAEPWSLRARPALLVMDMQSFFLDECSPAFLPSAPAILPRLRLLVDSFRSRGLPVVFTVHRDRDGPMQRWWGRSLDEEWSQAPAIAPAEGEGLLVKDVYDAFCDPDLEALLERAEVGTLAVTGVCAHLCVESTARSAFCRGYQVVLPADCAAAHNLNLHRGSLASLAHGFAHVTSCHELISKLEGRHG